MGKSSLLNTKTQSQFFALIASMLFLGGSGLSLAQLSPDEWVTLGGDFAHTRYSPADEINASNFSDLEVAW